jgi:type III secretory pathway component EscT
MFERFHNSAIQLHRRRPWALALLALLFAFQLAVLSAHPYQHDATVDDADCEICAIAAHADAIQVDAIVVAPPAMFAMVLVAALYVFVPRFSPRVSTRAPPVINVHH